MGHMHRPKQDARDWTELEHYAISALACNCATARMRAASLDELPFSTYHWGFLGLVFALHINLSRQTLRIMNR